MEMKCEGKHYNLLAERQHFASLSSKCEMYMVIYI